MLNLNGMDKLLWNFLPEDKKLGGIPCNLVYHAHQQVAKGRILSPVGDDELGKEVMELLIQMNLFAALIQVNENSANSVDVRLG
jgi:fructokinase